jgi:hypothetical protein
MKAEEAEKTLGLGLCFRCEHRAEFLENGFKPRFECGMEKMASSGCYMFMPCKPVAVAPSDGEKRPIFGPWMIAGRVRAQGLVDAEKLHLKLIDVSGYAVKGEPLETSRLTVTAVWTIKPKGKKTKK